METIDYLTIQQVAKKKNKSRATIQLMCKKGEIKSTKVLGRVLIAKSELPNIKFNPRGMQPLKAGLSVTDLVKKFHFTRAWIAKLANEGILPCELIGQRYVFKEKDLPKIEKILK